MTEVSPPIAEGKEAQEKATALIDRAGEIMAGLTGVALNQTMREGVGFSYLRGRIPGETDFEIRFYPENAKYNPNTGEKIKIIAPKRWTLLVLSGEVEEYAVTGDQDQYSYRFGDGPTIHLKKETNFLSYPTEERLRASLDRFAERAQKIKTSAQFR